MNRIVIPEIEFRYVGIRDAVDFLIKTARTNDPERKGVNIILLPSAEASFTNEIKTIQPHSITFSARNMTLRNALKFATTLTGLKCIVKGSEVMVMAQDEPEGELITRVYSITPQFIERIPVYGSDTSTNENASAPANLKEYFAGLDVGWPRGSFITYNSSCGKVFVRNTADNLHAFEIALRELNVVEFQVQVTAQFIQLDSTNVIQASAGAKVDDILMKCTNGHGRLLAAPTVTTRSGSETTIKSVTEVIYPTEFQCGGDGYTSETDNTNDVDDAGEPEVENALGVVPASFATRETGVILTILPEAFRSNDEVALTLKSSLVDPPTWKDYGHDMPMGMGESSYVPMEQPFFHVYACESQMTVRDGGSVLAFGGIPSSDGKGFIYCVITVRLVDTDGKPIRGEEKPYQPESIRLSTVR